MNDPLTSDQSMQAKQELLSGREVCLSVRGGSMWPFVRDGNILVIRPVGMEEIAVGDLAVTVSGQGLLCHRVFSKREGFIQTKGDALVGLDPAVGRENFLGMAVARKTKERVYPLTGRWARKLGWLISRGTVVTAPCYSFLGRLKRGIEGFFLGRKK